MSRPGASPAGVAVLVVGAALLGACGHSGHTADPSSPRPRPETYGHGALASEATRTVEVRMLDNLRFEPDHVAVRRGEVLTFHVVNAGRQPHEFTIGGPDAQELHDDRMASLGTSTSGGMTMGSGGMDMGSGTMNMPADAGPKKDQAALAKRIATLDKRAAASISVHVPAGEVRDVTWSFSGPKLPMYACHLPGHWKGGMQGAVAAT